MLHKGQVLPTPSEFGNLLSSLDKIGWRRTMEGMLSKETLHLDQDYIMTADCKLLTEQWMSGLLTRLLEATHGQWIYKILSFMIKYQD
jgi:hypothetical protein